MVEKGYPVSRRLGSALCGQFAPSHVGPWAPPKLLQPPPCKEPASLQELDIARGQRDRRFCWPYLFPEEQDLLREYLGEVWWCEERERLERLEPGEDLPVLV